MKLTASAALTVALLAGCASQAPLPVTELSYQQWERHQQAVQTLDQWSILGRVSLFDGDDVYNLGMSWTRNGENHQLKLNAALGQGVILIDKDSQSASLTTTEGKIYQDASAQQLLMNVAQLMIPVEGLETWIKGIPHNRSSAQPEIDGAGRARTLAQDGWKVNFFEYQSIEFDQRALNLPRKIYMKHDQLALKIVIDQWQPEISQDIAPLFPAID